MKTTTSTMPAANPARPGEPIAIVGIGCRLPGGADDPEAFWNLLAAGLEAIGPVPPDRWDGAALYHPDPMHAGRISVARGGFVSGIDRFDAGFFGISAREAARMDPQQRLLLEASHRAFEDAGVPADSLAGSRTAVFVGISTHDYADLQGAPSERLQVGAHTNTGGALSIAANRLSYTFDLRGPSVAVDTACSSSLVALHMACQSLWREESTAALVGGVNAILKPELHMGFARGGFLSPCGRCHAFDARADGYVRSEGVAVMLLKPLSRAQADGDRVYAVVRATVTNQDGRTPGLALPSEDAQTALLNEAYRLAGVSPAEVAYVEAHGTGTPAGDPIEARALGGALGRGRRDRPLLIGSVKTNLGHLEAGSGVAGLTKLALSMHRRQIPASLNVEQPNPAIPWQELGLRVNTALAPWPEGARFAGINSFGFGGANAHAVLELAPAAPARARRSPATETADRRHVLLVSARSEAALAALGTRYRERVADPAVDLAELCAASRVRASHHPQRLAVVGASRDELAAGLERALADAPDERVVRGRVEARRERRLAFVFSGQGPQWWGMARQMLAAEPVVRESIVRTDALFAPLAGWSLLDQLRCAEHDSRIDDTDVAQPLIFALQVALFEWLASLGIAPAAVLGHSVGEVAAAHAAGALSRAQAVQVIHHRSRLQQQAADRGGMLAVPLSEADARAAIAPWAPRLEIAAVNGPRAVTLAGDVDAVEEATTVLSARGVSCTRLRVRVPFHSRHLDPFAGDLAAALRDVSPDEVSGATFVSTVTGAALETGRLDAAYWVQNMRAPVQFLGALRAAMALGVDDFIELGPHPVHASAVRATIDEGNKAGLVLATLRRDADDRQALALAVAALHTAGHPVRWEAWGQPTTDARPVPYPFQRERFWVETPAGQRARLGATAHPFLGETLPRSAGVAASYRLDLDGRRHPYLDDHRIQGPIVFPGAGLVEVLLAAARAAFPDEPCELRDVSFETMLFIPDDDTPLEAHVTIHDDGEVGVWSRGQDGKEGKEGKEGKDGTPIRHVRGRVVRGAATAARPIAREEWDDRPNVEVDVRTVYAAVVQAGLALGPSFQGARRLRGTLRPDGAVEVTGEIVVHPSLLADFPRYLLHPAILDACFQSGLAAGQLARPGETLGAYVARQVGQLLFHRPPSGSVLTCYARVKPLIGDAIRVGSDIWVYDEAGHLVVEVRDFGAQYLQGSRGEDRVDPYRLFHEETWVEEPRPEAPVTTAPPARWLVIGDGALASALADRLQQGGTPVRQLADRDAAAAAALASAWVAEGPGAAIVAVGTAQDRVGAEWSVGPALDSGPLLLTAIARAILDRKSPAPIAVVTTGAQSVADEAPAALLQAGLWGFARVLGNEHPELAGALIDVGPAPSSAELDALVAELRASGPRDEILLRGSRRWARRLARLSKEQSQARATRRRGTDEAPFLIERPPSGILDDLRARASVRRAPGPGQVELAIGAVGLNFRDVLSATRAFGDDVLAGGYIGTALGGECAGRVTRVGEGVRGLAPGDRVMALAPGCLAGHALADARYVVAIPPALDDAQAASVLVAYLTAWLGLVDLGRLRAGESVLIHAAAGGVGVAAVHLARHLGARVLATAGNDEKRAFVRGLGAELVMDSRRLSFADELRAHTGGRGVDVVLNSLTGRAIDASLGCLAPYGRFVEIGKRDLIDNRRVGLRVMLENRTYAVLDLNTMLADAPDRIVAALRELAPLFGTPQAAGEGGGVLPPPPVRTFPVDRTADALKHFAQARHIGKIAVQVAGATVDVAPPTDARALFERPGTFVVSGGVRGFGLATARWLVERGARHLVLVGRSGRVEPGTTTAIEEMRGRGAEVRVRALDIAEAGDVRRLFAEIERELPAVRGIVHAAMVLDDDALLRLDRSRWEAVFRPKVAGALNLHEASLGHPVAMFVCYSSFSGIYGNPGQASYAAANATLDAFARWRRAQGRPALSLAWGALADAGVVARDRRLAGLLAAQGFEALTAREALGALERALADDHTQVAALRIDWSKARHLPGAAAGRFAGLRPRDGGAGEVRAGSAAELGTLARTDRSAGLALVITAVRDLVSRVVCHPAEAIDTRASLTDLGFDSLMTNQLVIMVDERFGVAPSFTEMMRGPTVEGVAGAVIDLMAQAAPARPWEG